MNYNAFLSVEPKDTSEKGEIKTKLEQFCK